MSDNEKTKLIVLGGGPGGYPAAFMAADMGIDVTLIDMKKNPGGVCLFQGCIPSKTLLHAAKIIHEASEAHGFGIDFGQPDINVEQLRDWKNKVVGRLTGGLGQLSKQRKVNFIEGRGRIVDPNTVAVQTSDGQEQTLSTDYIIVATGSQPTRIASFPDDPDIIWDSTKALELDEVPGSLLVVGGGYIGLELGTVYSALGSNVTVVEALNGILPTADRDLVEHLERSVTERFDALLTNTRVDSISIVDGKAEVKLLGLDLENPTRTYDRVLVSVGRTPNARDIGLENTAVEVDDKGFIRVDAQRRTAEESIFAIGDVAGEPMLAHKATYEARIAAETIAGQTSAFDPKAIPAVVFTDPEVAWAGLTENQARTDGVPHKVARFPWAASGRATSVGRNDGLTKMLLDPVTERLLGVGIVGVGAGELIAEATLAIEMGATATDMKMTVHAHPTLSETVMEAAEVFYGHSPHFMERKR